jgi:large repetitive protein
MRRRLKAFLIAGALLALDVTQTATASAAGPFPGPLTIDTGSYTCTQGVCDMGSGNVGAFFAGAATSFGGTGPTPYTWSVVAGSLPTDMLLTPSYGVYSAYVYGKPTTVGTTTFTLQVRDGVGDTARQAFSITINPGTPLPPDSVTIISAKWSAHQHRLFVVATDPLQYLTLTASVTSTGQKLCSGQNCTGTLFTVGNGQYTGSFFSEANPQNITVRSNQGASTTSAVTPIK